MSNNKLCLSLLFSCLAIIMLLSLGTWQLERLKWKTTILSSMKNSLSLPPLEISNEIIKNIDNYSYRRISLTGYYLYDNHISIYSKVLDRQVGKNLVVPFKTDHGYILINRGFIPNNYNIKKNIKPKVVKINGVIKFQQEIKYFTPKNNIIKNEWYYINIDEISDFSNLPLLKFYIIEDDNIDEKYPIGSQYNFDVPNDHLQYAITWFSLALALSIFINIFWRKNVY
jgi:surfeit locus 1 family protein